MKSYILTRAGTVAIVVLRMAIGVGLISAVAAISPPEAFGKFGIAFGMGQLVGLLSNFGFQVALIRDGSREIANMRQRTFAALVVKTTTAVIIVIPISCLALGPIEDTGELITLLMLIFTLILGSYGDLLFAVLRALKGLRAELSALVVTATLLCAGIVLVAYFDGTIVHIVWVLAVTRSAYTAQAVYSYLLAFPMNQGAETQSVPKYLRDNLSLGLEGVAINTTTQLDSLLVANSLGFESAGVYQAGARIAYGVFPVAATLNTLTIPKVARANYDSPGRLWSVLRLCMIEYVALAAICGLALLFLGPFYSRTFLDSAYGPVTDLWPLFAVYVFFKIFASGMGVFLSVIHTGWLRLATLVTILASYVLFIPPIGKTFGIEGVVCVVIATAIFQIIAFSAIIFAEIARTRKHEPTE